MFWQNASFKLNRVFVVAVNFLQIDDVTLERRCFICLVVSSEIQPNTAVAKIKWEIVLTLLLRLKVQWRCKVGFLLKIVGFYYTKTNHLEILASVRYKQYCFDFCLQPQCNSLINFRFSCKSFTIRCFNFL